MNGVWVGSWEETQLVYDPSIQPKSDQFIYLWDTTKMNMRKFIPALIRQQIRTVHDQSLIESCTAIYVSWRAECGRAWMEKEVPAFADSIQRENREIRRSFARRLLQMESHEKAAISNTDYQDTGFVYNPGKDYSNHCNSCAGPLSSQSNFWCKGCGLLICLCGSCGCPP